MKTKFDNKYINFYKNEQVLKNIEKMNIIISVCKIRNNFEVPGLINNRHIKYLNNKYLDLS
jgi:hypothetical protein